MNINVHYLLNILPLITIAALSVFILWQWKQHKNEISAIDTVVNQSQKDIQAANARLSAVFQISQKFVEAEREGDIINELLSLSMNLTGAMGASFVPFDNHGQPLAATRLGNFPFPVPDAWLEYIASPAVRGECMNCKRHESIVTTCPLLNGPFLDALGLYCLPLQRGKREYGILNLYMPDTSRLDESTRIFIRSLLDATALAIEGVRLRESERETLYQLRSVQQHADSKLLLRELLDNACDILEADFGLLVPGRITNIDEKLLHLSGEILISGEIPDSILGKLNEITQRIYTKNEHICEEIKRDSNKNNTQTIYLIGMPVFSSEKISKGVILIVREGEKAFQNGYLISLSMISSQIGLVLHITNQLSEITYKTMMDERIRLAREIHDGLAQTLGFLKLLVAQMQGYIDQGDFDRLNRIARTCSQTIAEAYQDAREAIDGLRVMPVGEGGQSGSDLSIWLEQTISEFRENQEIHPIIISLKKDDLNLNLSTEIQAQLIRIIQEALSNVRKHAHANEVNISIHKSEGDLIIEIRDNGLGFSPEEVPGPSQHGLRGMRERTELIGADFQIISFEGTGTTVRIRLPRSIYEQWEKDI